MITNLTIKRGGVKGIAYVYALKVLESHLLLNSPKMSAGPDADSLRVGLKSTCHDADTIKKWMDTSNFKKLKGELVSLIFFLYKDIIQVLLFWILFKLFSFRSHHN